MVHSGPIAGGGGCWQGGGFHALPHLGMLPLLLPGPQLAWMRLWDQQHGAEPGPPQAVGFTLVPRALPSPTGVFSTQDVLWDSWG